DDVEYDAAFERGLSTSPDKAIALAFKERVVTPFEESRSPNFAERTGSNLGLPDANSIAVLPFAHMSSAADDEYFCDGLAEELINALAKIEELKVAARTSAFSFKGKNINIGEIGRALNVANVLEGSV